jgi:hypothetical protein
MTRDLEKVFAQYRKWSDENPIDTHGIVIGADLTQQWLLPWWWDHYRNFNSFPVAFVDFGMSGEMKKWCQERGELINLPVASVFVAEKEEIDPKLVVEMENACGDDFWPSRNAWFKKPLACLRSPFRRSLWIDLDCQIRGPLDELFLFCNHSIAMAKEQYGADQDSYNTGVIAFKHGTQTIEDWAAESFEYNHLFRGDQDVFNALIKKKQLPITTLPQIYNWSRRNEANPQAVILHWHGPQGKSEIIHQIARANLKILTH